MAAKGRERTDEQWMFREGMPLLVEHVPTNVVSVPDADQFWSEFEGQLWLDLEGTCFGNHLRQ